MLCLIDPPNTASCRVADKVGFQWHHRGTWNDDRTRPSTSCTGLSERVDDHSNSPTALSNPEHILSQADERRRVVSSASFQCVDDSSCVSAAGSTKYRTRPQSPQTTARIFADENGPEAGEV